MPSGLEAEREAADFLQGCGLVILDRRYRSRAGEIDLVARDGRSVVFIEVKSRSSVAFGGPEAAVTPVKQRRLARAAAAYLAERRLENTPARFDVVAVTPDGIRHITDAFRPS